MKYKLTEEEAHNIIYSMWESGLVPDNFTEQHTQYFDAIIFTRVHGYFDINYFNTWLTM